MRFAFLIAAASLALAFPFGTAQAAVMASGQFHDGPHAPEDRAKGTVEIVKTDGGGYELRLSDDFASDKGPDLVMVMSTVADAKDDATVAKSELLNLGPLKSLTGAQSFALPADFDASKWKSVAVWCKKFNVLFGIATLAQ